MKMKTLAHLASALKAIVITALLPLISYSGTNTLNGGTLTLADYYSDNVLEISGDSTINVALNFPSIWNGPLIGSSALTLTGYFGGQLSLVNNTGNTFDGNLIVDSGTFRVAGNPFAVNAGFTAPSMTSGSTITINRAGTLTIDDNAFTGGYVANRFGTSGDRPAVSLAGGTLNLSGLNNATSSVQTFGALTSSSGQGTINVTRNTSGNPTLAFDSLSVSSGSLLTFNGANLGTGTSDSRITFATNPNLNGVIVGARFYSGSPGTSDLATYGANGVKALTTFNLDSNDISGATSTQNVKASGTLATLSTDVTVNSLTLAGAGPWLLGTKTLTIATGMLLRNNTNSDPNITNGKLTAGNGTDDIDLHVIVAQNNMTIGAVIADNASSAVTLVKSGDERKLTLSGSANNTYSGGTYVVGGTLTTGTTASRAYLGTGKVTVDGIASVLTLGAIGATSSATSDDFTAKNGGTITLSSGNHGTVDTFNIGANSIIAGASATGQGLASLTRGTTITLAAGAIIGHAILGSPLTLTTGTIQNLGTNADLYYGFYLNQNNAAGAVTIGSGTAFRGISTDRSAKEWQLGTINIASGTTSVDFQGHATHGTAAVLTLGNGATGGAPVITVADAGTVDINAIGALTINDSTATFGNTGSGQNIRFVATAGSTLTVTAATGMGSGANGIASAIVNNGGSLAIGAINALNGAVTVEAGGRLTASQASLTGAGALTFNAGSILQISTATGFSGAQATAATVNAGTIVRLGAASFGAVGETLDSYLSTKSPIYQIFGDNRTAANPTSAGTTTITLNKNGSGVGGMLINDLITRTFGGVANGKITLGANGGVIAATSNTQITLQEEIDGAGTLTIGTTDIIDGAPKLGIVRMDMVNANTYTGGTIVNAGTVALARANMLGALTNPLTVNTGGKVDMSAADQTVGNLTGTGGIINAAGRTLNIGQGDNGGGNYQGSIQGAGGKLTKTGTGTITLSGANTYSGATAINGGKLFINGDQTSASGTVSVSANATLGGTGTIGGSTTIADTGKLEFDISTAAGSHDKLDLAATKTLTFSGASTLTINSVSGATTGLYTLLTAPGGISGSAPATVNLPAGWTADAPTISGNDLVINITSTGGGTPTITGTLIQFLAE